MLRVKLDGGGSLHRYRRRPSRAGLAGDVDPLDPEVPVGDYLTINGGNRLTINGGNGVTVNA